MDIVKSAFLSVPSTNDIEITKPGGPMESYQKIMPILPVKATVVLPGGVTSVYVGRTNSLQSVNFAIQNKTNLFIIAQKDQNVEEPKLKDLHSVGTITAILQVIKFPDESLKITVQGKVAARMEDIEVIDGVKKAIVQPLVVIENKDDAREIQVLIKIIARNFNKYINLNPRIHSDIALHLKHINDHGKIVDIVAQYLVLKNEDRQILLETVEVTKRLNLLIAFLQTEIEILNTEQKIRGRVKLQIEKTQREYYLVEQMKAIQEELGVKSEPASIAKLRQKINKLAMSKENKERVFEDLQRLKNMSPTSTEASVIQNYMDCIASLPWNKYRKIKVDLEKACRVLDNNHYGLEKVKDRVVEYLAVQARTNQSSQGTIMCLMGPPGVGKTSLGKSIAKATGRDFLHISLGGIVDEAEIRGHRRTYIGSMPGKIIQSLRKVKYNNPLIMLDEIDKLGSDYRGDPAAAILQILDPSQNVHFSDHYLELDYDLSQIMFICTANTFNMSLPLLDRMEIIPLAGYTEKEKIQIAKKHIIKKQLKLHGLTSKDLRFATAAVRDIISYYTHEAGVRNMEREIAKICRKVVKKIMISKHENLPIRIQVKDLEEYLGVRKYFFDKADKINQIGVANGLAWTEYGGDILMIESVIIPHGKGRMQFTGKLGRVMQESIQASKAYIGSKMKELNIDADVFNNYDLHIHVPAGAIPKDGPSAGVAIVTSIMSSLTKTPIKKSVAMTGEISLRGRVLAVGGLKEKIIAAHRGNIKTVIVPQDNMKDIKEIKEIQNLLEIRPVSHVWEVLDIALEKSNNKNKTHSERASLNTQSRKQQVALS